MPSKWVDNNTWDGNNKRVTIYKCLTWNKGLVTSVKLTEFAKSSKILHNDAHVADTGKSYGKPGIRIKSHKACSPPWLTNCGHIASVVWDPNGKSFSRNLH